MNLCPRDHTSFTSNDANGYRYYSCSHCKGFWLPGASIQRAMSTQGVSELQVAPRGPRSRIRCPECRSEFELLTIGGCHLDICPRCHGVWLDSGEARRIRRLFPEGSAVIIADKTRPSKQSAHALNAPAPTDVEFFSVLEAVGELVWLIFD